MLSKKLIFKIQKEKSQTVFANVGMSVVVAVGQIDLVIAIVSEIQVGASLVLIASQVVQLVL
jgi:hypothetical protein